MQLIDAPPDQKSLVSSQLLSFLSQFHFRPVSQSRRLDAKAAAAATAFDRLPPIVAPQLDQPRLIATARSAINRILGAETERGAHVAGSTALRHALIARFAVHALALGDRVPAVVESDMRAILQHDYEQQQQQQHHYGGGGAVVQMVEEGDKAEESGVVALKEEEEAGDKSRSSTHYAGSKRRRSANASAGAGAGADASLPAAATDDDEPGAKSSHVDISLTSSPSSSSSSSSSSSTSSSSQQQQFADLPPPLSSGHPHLIRPQDLFAYVLRFPTERMDLGIRFLYQLVDAERANPERLYEPEPVTVLLQEEEEEKKKKEKEKLKGEAESLVATAAAVAAALPSLDIISRESILNAKRTATTSGAAGAAGDESSSSSSSSSSTSTSSAAAAVPTVKTESLVGSSGTNTAEQDAENLAEEKVLLDEWESFIPYDEQEQAKERLKAAESAAAARRLHTSALSGYVETQRLWTAAFTSSASTSTSTSSTSSSKSSPTPSPAAGGMDDVEHVSSSSTSTSTFTSSSSLSSSSASVASVAVPLFTSQLDRDRGLDCLPLGEDDEEEEEDEKGEEGEKGEGLEGVPSAAAPTAAASEAMTEYHTTGVASGAANGAAAARLVAAGSVVGRQTSSRLDALAPVHVTALITSAGERGAEHYASLLLEGEHMEFLPDLSVFAAAASADAAAAAAAGGAEEDYDGWEEEEDAATGGGGTSEREEGGHGTEAMSDASGKLISVATPAKGSYGLSGVKSLLLETSAKKESLTSALSGVVPSLLALPFGSPSSSSSSSSSSMSVLGSPIPSSADVFAKLGKTSPSSSPHFSSSGSADTVTSPSLLPLVPSSIAYSNVLGMNISAPSSPSSPMVPSAPSSPAATHANNNNLLMMQQSPSADEARVGAFGAAAAGGNNTYLDGGVEEAVATPESVLFGSAKFTIPPLPSTMPLYEQTLLQFLAAFFHRGASYARLVPYLIAEAPILPHSTFAALYVACHADVTRVAPALQALREVARTRPAQRRQALMLLLSCALTSSQALRGSARLIVQNDLFQTASLAPRIESFVAQRLGLLAEASFPSHLPEIKVPEELLGAEEEAAQARQLLDTIRAQVSHAMASAVAAAANAAAALPDAVTGAVTVSSIAATPMKPMDSSASSTSGATAGGVAATPADSMIKTPFATINTSVPQTAKERERQKLQIELVEKQATVLSSRAKLARDAFETTRTKREALRTEEAVVNLELALALCVKKPSLFASVIDMYVAANSLVRNSLRTLLATFVNSLPFMDSKAQPTMVSLKAADALAIVLETAPTKAHAVVLQILDHMTGVTIVGGAPTPATAAAGTAGAGVGAEDVEASSAAAAASAIPTRALPDRFQTVAWKLCENDARFVLSLIPSLDKTQAQSLLPRLLTLQSAVVNNAMSRLLRITSPPLTPTELLMELFRLGTMPTVSVQVASNAAGAITECLKDVAKFTPTVLNGIITNVLSASTPVTPLALRVTQQAVTIAPSLIPSAAMMLEGVVRKSHNRWNEAAWAVFIDTCTLLGKMSMPVVLALHKTRREDLLSKVPAAFQADFAEFEKSKSSLFGPLQQQQQQQHQQQHQSAFGLMHAPPSHMPLGAMPPPPALSSAAGGVGAGMMYRAPPAMGAPPSAVPMHMGPGGMHMLTGGIIPGYPTHVPMPGAPPVTGVAPGMLHHPHHPHLHHHPQARALPPPAFGAPMQPMYAPPPLGGMYMPSHPHSMHAAGVKPNTAAGAALPPPPPAAGAAGSAPPRPPHPPSS